MNRIDQLAYCSPLKDMHPAEKLILASSSLLLIISLDSYLLSVLVLSLMSYLLLIKSRVDSSFYLKIMSIPVGFLLLGCLSIAITSCADQADYIYCLHWGSFRIGVSGPSLKQAGQIFFKSLAAISCLYFIALTTPMTQLMYIMQRIKLPPVLIDLMTIIYSHIFIFGQTANEIYIAQLSRGGYQGFMASMKSWAALCSNLLLKSLRVSEEAFNCLLSRGFDGHLRVVQEIYQFRSRNILTILAWDVLLLLLYYSGRYFTCPRIF